MMDYVKPIGCYQPLTYKEDSANFIGEDVALADITKSTPDNFAINFWVQKEILKYSCLSKRTEVLSFFIKIAKKLVEYRNLYSAMSIVSALQIECIYRLRHTWLGLSSKDGDRYKRLEELFSQDGNCSRQREYMKSSSLPGIPYLGVYLSDLTYTNLSQPRVNGKPSATWLTKINKIVDEIAYYQQSEYSFAVDETLNAYLCAQRYIEEFQKFLEDDNYKISLSLEPPPPQQQQSTISSPPPPPLIKSPKLSSDVLIPIVEQQQQQTSNRPTSHLHPFNHHHHHHHHHYHASHQQRYSKAALVNSSFESDLDELKPSQLSAADSHKTLVDCGDHQVKSVVDGKLDNCGAGHLEVKVSKSEVDSSAKSTTNGLPPVPRRHIANCALVTSNANNAIASATSKSNAYEVNDDNGCYTKTSSLPGAFVESTDGSSAKIKSRSIENGKSETLGSTAFDNKLSHLSSSSASLTSSTAAAVACAVLMVSNGADSSRFDHESKSQLGTYSDALVTSTPPSSPSKVQSKISLESVCAKHKSLIPLHTPSLSYHHFGVRVIYQGVVERRTIARHWQAKRFSDKFDVQCSFSSTSLSTCSGAGTNTLDRNTIQAANMPVEPFSPRKQQTNSLTRPSNFSKWRRLWATLVLVGDSLAAYMIYFEPKVRSAVHRNQFHAHQCQIQSLISPSTITHPSVRKTFSQPRKCTLTNPCPNSIDDSFELLSDDTTDDATRDVFSWMPPSRPNAVQVVIGKHRDGSTDLNSFCIVDLALGKTYRFRPTDDELLLQSKQSTTNQHRRGTSGGPFHWIRRATAAASSGILSPNRVVNPKHTSDVVSVNRARGLSSPGIFNYSLRSDASTMMTRSHVFGSGVSSLNRNRNVHRNSLSDVGDVGTTDDNHELEIQEQLVQRWMQSIQRVLDHIQTAQWRQLAINYESHI